MLAATTNMSLDLHNDPHAESSADCLGRLSRAGFLTCLQFAAGTNDAFH